MENIMALSQFLSEIMERLALGFSMFGDHAIWLIMLPFFWSIATCMIWIKIENDDELRDQAYVTNAERNLPKLRELTKQRSTEILDIRGIDRDTR